MRPLAVRLDPREPSFDLRQVSPDELKQARKTLACSVKELAAALDVEPATLMAWERGELFPTKRHVEHIARLVAEGGASIPRKVAGAGPLEALRDPDVWMIVRKLLAHPKLRSEVAKLCEKYDEP
jgi:transcriptional regulator with XRE-family HTH domain